MTENHHAVVVGGGVIGLSIAWELAKRGLRVRLLERDRIGGATSWAGTGILPPANLSNATDPIDQLRGLSHGLYPEWTDELKSITGIDSGFRRCGGWYLADTAGERAAMQAMTLYWDELGIVCQSVSTQSLAERAPALASWARRSSDASAWWVPDECQIRSPRYLRALQQACRCAGVDLIENSMVTGIRMTGQRAEIRLSDRWHPSDSIIVCCGAWTPQVAKSIGLQRSIIPIRGQMLLLKTESPVCQSVINVGQRYVVCREDGYTLVGSCEEEVGLELGTTPAMLQSLRDFAVSLIPELERAQQVDSWSGLRPLTYDGFPMIGRAPGSSNLYVAAGHFRSGIHLSPGTAVILADLITGRQPPISLDSFRVGKQLSASVSEVLEGSDGR